MRALSNNYLFNQPDWKARKLPFGIVFHYLLFVLHQICFPSLRNNIPEMFILAVHALCRSQCKWHWEWLLWGNYDDRLAFLYICCKCLPHFLYSLCWFWYHDDTNLSIMSQLPQATRPPMNPIRKPSHGLHTAQMAVIPTSPPNMPVTNTATSNFRFR